MRVHRTPRLHQDERLPFPVPGLVCPDHVGRLPLFLLVVFEGQWRPQTVVFALLVLPALPVVLHLLPLLPEKTLRRGVATPCRLLTPLLVAPFPVVLPLPIPGRFRHLPNPYFQ